MVPLDLYSRSRVGDGMTNVEALMAVEAGEQPSECKIYYERDERKLWALWLVLSALAGLAFRFEEKRGLLIPLTAALFAAAVFTVYLKPMHDAVLN